MQWHMPMIADIDTPAHYPGMSSDSKRKLSHLEADDVRLLMFEEPFQGSMREPEVWDGGDLVRHGQCIRGNQTLAVSGVCLDMSASPEH